MGVDTKALLTSAPDILDILNYVTERYRNASLMRAGVEPYFYYVDFKDGSDQRHVALFPPGKCASDYADFWPGPAVYISMGHWGNSELIARRMVVHFGGGFIQPNDCRDDWQRVEPEGNDHV